MKYVSILVIPLLLIACEGPVGPDGEQGVMGVAGIDGSDGANGIDGSDGAQGIPGEPGPGTRTVITGPVVSDNMFITINGLTEASPPAIDVFVCPPTFACVPLPFTVFLGGVAAFSTNFQLTNGGIWLNNAKSMYEVAGTTSAIYVIVMVE